MWTFHPTVGFFSAVKDALKPGNVLVRFRDPEHAKAFADYVRDKTGFKRPRVRTTPPPADYRWKLSLDAGDYAATVTELATEVVDYGNFKSECGKRPLMRSTLDDLHDVWHTMHRHQTRITSPARRDRVPMESYEGEAEERKGRAPMKYGDWYQDIPLKPVDKIGEY